MMERQELRCEKRELLKVVQKIQMDSIIPVGMSIIQGIRKDGRKIKSGCT